MSDTAEAKYKYDKNSPKLSELPRVGRNWAAVAYARGKSREEARVSTQLVLNKYNTNYEALRLTDWLH